MLKDIKIEREKREGGRERDLRGRKVERDEKERKREIE